MNKIMYIHILISHNIKPLTGEVNNADRGKRGPSAVRSRKNGHV